VQLETGAVDQETAAEIAALEPWMNPFRLGDGWLLGWHKAHGLTRTSVPPGDPDHPAHQQAFDDYMAGDPFWQMDQLLDVVGTDASVLELGCGTGRLAFHLALRGARVVGVDISSRNIEAARLVQRLDPRLGAVDFEHVPLSADDPAFMAGAAFDAVVVSVFPFLSNVTVQLDNLARLTRKTALLHVICRPPPDSDGWQLMRSTPEWLERTYAAGLREILHGSESGWGWRPSPSALVHSLQFAGFGSVREITHPQLSRIRSVQAKMATGSAIANRLRSRRMQREIAQLGLRHQSPAYRTFLADKA
jgi:SAM-dependent methyltransferase